MAENKVKENLSGILAVCKQKGKNSFSLVSELRKITKIKKIGHSGTLDPFAEGVMLMLLGREYTRKSAFFLGQEKEYEALFKLGFTTETLDTDSQEEYISDYRPAAEEIRQAVKLHFQGVHWQKIPFYSAKKIRGKPLYKFARKGIKIRTEEKKVHLKTSVLEYDYPCLRLHIACSAGTYIRQMAEDLGKILKTGAYVQDLLRLRVGTFHLSDCVKQEDLFKIDISKHLMQKSVFLKKTAC